MVTVMRDAKIQWAVERELAWDPRIEHGGVEAVVQGGVVTLTGHVPSYTDRLAAQEAAHRVAGVLDVAIDIQVELPASRVRADTEIAQAIRPVLEWDVAVPHERIKTTVANGWITLEGEVDDWYEREDAELALRNLVGVRGITNHIRVRALDVTAEITRQEIEEVLERRADRAAHHIRVTADPDGRVTLSGPVRSWYDKRALLGAARHTRGVRDVEDRLRIDPTS